MRFSFEGGIVCQNGHGKFLVDPKSAKQKQRTAVISHAHSDHFTNGFSKAWMTPETHALLQNRHSSLKNTHSAEYKKKFVVEGCNVSFHNAGHVLGSSQILMESDQTVLISSDFNPVDSILFPAALPQKCDTLIVESTFGLAQYAFPSRERVHDEMGNWIKQQISQNRFVVLAGYALGKSQELTRIANDFAGIAPIVHDQIFANNQTYEKFGVELGDYVKLDHNLKDSNLLILPPSLMDKHLVSALEFSTGKKVVTANATGWEYRGGFSKSFCLSDHADFNGLLEFVAACNPKQVLTMHGFSRELASAITRKLKIPARSLETGGQLGLNEFVAD